MEYFLLIGVAVVVLAGVALWFDQKHPRHLRAKIDRQREDLATAVQQRFLVLSCVRCHEFEMKLLELSPNGRSIHYECLHCAKKYRAPAGSPDTAHAVELWKEFRKQIKKHIELCGLPTREEDEAPFDEVRFATPAAPMPYEQTTRTPIPEAVRGEVWRRDCGKCVECGTRQNLQFDHIIPVSLGGATTVANLQLLCQPCNSTKSDRI